MSSVRHKEPIVTMSWDDGHPLDLRVAELMAKYGMRGTFYLPVRNHEHKVMDRSDIVKISSEFEIGGHTLNHLKLTGISSDDEIYREISIGKTVMEDSIGKEITTFAYPKGCYNRQIKYLVEKAGFKGARSASWFHDEYPDDLFCIHPTIHIYPHKSLIHVGHLIKELNFRGLNEYLLIYRGTTDLKKLTVRCLDKIIEKGGVFHIWGHSWEIEELGLWVELEEIMSHISEFKNVVRLTNGEIISYMEKQP